MVISKAVIKKCIIKPFIYGDVSTYSFKIIELCPKALRVVFVHCQFCICFDFDDNPTKPLHRQVHKTINITWTNLSI